MKALLVALFIALGLYAPEPPAPVSYLAHGQVCTLAYPQGFDGFQRLSPYFGRRVLMPCDHNVIPEIAKFECFPERAA